VSTPDTVEGWMVMSTRKVTCPVLLSLCQHLERLYKACEGVIQLAAGVSTAINTTHAYT